MPGQGQNQCRARPAAAVITVQVGIAKWRRPSGGPNGETKCRGQVAAPSGKNEIPSQDGRGSRSGHGLAAGADEPFLLGGDKWRADGHC